MNEWQPIETAPKDPNSEILIAEPDHDYPIDIANWNLIGYWENQEGITLNPTHWMPLPEPPAKG